MTAVSIQHPTRADRPLSLAHHPVRRRLWKGGIALGIVLAIFITFDVRARITDPNPKLALGHDLLPSYAAGVVIRQGRPRAMYDRDTLSAIEQRIIRDADLEIDGRFGPWLNPPFFAWVFAPLAALPYRTAAAVFLVVNIALFVVALTLLTRLFVQDPMGGNISFSGLACEAFPACDEQRRSRVRQGGPYVAPKLDWKFYALVPLLTLLPLPFWQAMGHQQNTFISFTILLVAVTLWRNNKSFAAGVVAGLLFFKPQLAAVFAIVLVIATGWRALIGIAVTGTILLVITLVTLPGCLSDYLHRLPPILHWLQMEAPFNWGRQVTFQSFWRLLLQGHVRGETAMLAKALWALCSGGFVVLTVLAIRNFLSGLRDPIARDRLIAAAIASMPVLMPYYMDYDLLLLAIPAVLLAAEWVRHPELITRADYALLGTWVVFGIESHFNPGVAGHCRLNPGVAILAVIAVLHFIRCIRIPIAQLD